MGRENEGLSNNSVLTSCQCKSNYFSNILRREGLGTLVEPAGFLLIALEPDKTELGLNGTGLNLEHPNSGVDKLLAQTVRERVDRCFGGTVNRATRIGVQAGDGTNVGECRHGHVRACRAQRSALAG